MKNKFPRLNSASGLGGLRRRPRCRGVRRPRALPATLAIPRSDPRLTHCTRVVFRRPMMDLHAAKAVTGLDEVQVLRAVDAGRIRWVFNLGVGCRKYLLFLTRSVVGCGETTLNQPATLEQLGHWLLPSNSLKTGNVRGTDLQFAFNITSEQVLKLHRAGLIFESRHSRRHAGCGGSPLFTRASVMRLLKKRRLL